MNYDNLVPDNNNQLSDNIAKNLITPEMRNYMSSQTQKAIIDNLTSSADTISKINNPVNKTNELIEQQNSIIRDLQDRLDHANKTSCEIQKQLEEVNRKNDDLQKSIDEKSKHIRFIEENNTELQLMNQKIKVESNESKLFWALVPSLVVFAMDHFREIYSFILMLIGKK